MYDFFKFRFIVLFLLVALLCNLFSGYALCEKEKPAMFEAITYNEFHLRSSPGSEKQSSLVPKHKTVTVYDYKDGWYLIKYKKDKGWAKDKWLWAFRSLDPLNYQVPGYTKEAGILILTENVAINGDAFRNIEAIPGCILTVSDVNENSFTVRVWRESIDIPRSAGAYSQFVPWQDAAPGDLIGGFSTYYTPRQGAPLHLARQHNIAVGCEYLNDYILQPNETFSFNTTCGPYRCSKGYKNAKNISKTGQGIGGGVCQVTTTLFNAVLGLPMLITEWGTHQYTGVDYVPVSFDAAVSSILDFKFTNLMDYPVRFFATAQSGVITVLIYRAGK